MRQCGRTFMLNLSAKVSKVTHRTPQIKDLHNKTAHFLSMAYEENFVKNPQSIEWTKLQTPQFLNFLL